MPLVLIYFFKKCSAISKDIKLINQVHDSIVVDAPTNLVEDVAEAAYQVFKSLPELMLKHYGYKWVVPITSEVKFGSNWSDMELHKRRTNG
jgi:DNA polymerase I-like protein with 3'-5' exonuclease and polymerase domains